MRLGSTPGWWVRELRGGDDVIELGHRGQDVEVGHVDRVEMHQRIRRSGLKLLHIPPIPKDQVHRGRDAST